MILGIAGSKSRMTISDWAIVLATALSPLIAIQVQKFIEHATERTSAQKRIFYALMATRAAQVAPEHVQALNMIDLEFGGPSWRGKTAKEREVITRWRIYADHLNVTVDDSTNQARVDAWIDRSDVLFTDLLEALAKALGYNFNRVEIQRGIYRPRAHNLLDARAEFIQRALAEVLAGKTPLAMRVTEFPVSDEAVSLQTRLQEGMLAAVEGGSLKVTNVNR